MNSTCLLTTVCLVVSAAAAGAQTPASARPAPPRGFLSVGVGYQATANDFRDSTTFPLNAETANLGTDYAVSAGPTFDVAGGAAIWRNLAVSVGVTRYSTDTDANLSASLPHPFFFNQNRTINETVTGLSRSELAIHLQARGLLPVRPNVLVMLFGGPSFFNVKQDAVTDITYADVFPYDEVTFQAPVATDASERTTGFNVGADVSVFFSRQVGVGFGAMFARASVDLPGLRGGTVTVDAGGLQAGGGLRLRF